MVMSFVRRAALTSLAPLLLLGACAEDKPDPPAAEPTSSPPSATTSAAEPSAATEPTLPPEAEGTGPEAAEAFVRHYLAAVDHSRKQLDSSSIRALSAADCRGCTGLSDLLDEVRRNGGTIAGGDQTPTSVRARRLADSGDPVRFRATATVKTTEQVITGSGVDGLDGLRDAETLRYAFDLMRTDSTWEVTQWDIV